MIEQLRTKAPFSDPSGNKGWLGLFARAQPHSTSEVSVYPPGWQFRKNPLRVAVLADLHVGSHADDVSRMQKIVGEVNRWTPDIVLLLGDFMNTQILGGGRVPPETIADILHPIVARLGVYAILGNHDWRYDGLAVRRALEASHIRVMENRSHKVADIFGDFWIVGLADDKTRTPEVERTLSTVPVDAPTIIMAHDPATFAEVPSGPYLTLCGHTHGGQIRLPIIGPMINASRAPLKWTSGYIVEDGKHLFVSRGLGTSLLPVRFNCRPELALLSVGS